MTATATTLVTGIGEPLLGRVLVIDSLRGRTDEVPLHASVAHTTPTAPPPLPHVDVAGALAAQAAGATLIDVREPYETAAGVIPGAVTLPLARLLADTSQVGSGPVNGCSLNSSPAIATRYVRATMAPNAPSGTASSTENGTDQLSYSAASSRNTNTMLRPKMMMVLLPELISSRLRPEKS